MRCYLKIYDQLMESRKARGAPEGYSEKHHIIPKSMGGSNRAENIVRLTPREHLFAHKMLAHGHNTRGMWFAYLTMCSPTSLSARGVRSGLRDYQKARSVYGQKCKENHPFKGKKFSEEHKRKALENRTLLYGPDHPMWGKTHTKESKIKMSKSNKRLSGKDHPMWKRTHTPEARKRISENMKSESSPSVKHDIVSLVHSDGTIFVGSRFEFRKKFNIASDGNLSRFLSGHSKSHKGWKRHATENS